MARIPLPGRERLSHAQRLVYDAIARGPRAGVRGPFLAALHSPELADKWQQLGEILRYRSSLSPRLGELAILVTARHWDCQYEWFAHAPLAQETGLPAPAIEAIAQGRSPALDDAMDRIVYDYACELHRQRSVSAETHKRATEALGVTGVVELTALLGYYAMVAMTLNAHDILPPDNSTPLPVLPAA